MHTQRKKGVGGPLVRRSTVKRQLDHLYRSVLLGLFLSSGQWSAVFFHTWPSLGPSPWMHTQPSAKMDLELKASGRSKTHSRLELSPDFWLQGALLSMCSVSFTLYSDRIFASLCPCHDYSLEILQATKTVYLPCFCCYFHFQEQIRCWLEIPELEPSYFLL